MERENITLPYKIILKKFWHISQFGLVKIHDAKNIIRGYFRLGSENFNPVCCEMKRLGYIEYVNKRVGMRILIDMKDLV